MKNTYTISFLKKNIVNVSKETPDSIFSEITKKLGVPEGPKATQFVANHNKSKIFYTIPQEIIFVLGRFFQKKEQLELGYLLEEDIWYIIEEGSLLWSSKVLQLKRKKKTAKGTRYEILKKKL